MKPVTPSTHWSDAELFAAARRALDDNPAVPAAVRVHLDGGVVTLTGSARVPAERLEAEETVRRLAGVRRVVNDIFVGEVPSAGLEPPDDADRFGR